MAIDESVPSDKSVLSWIGGEAKESVDDFIAQHPPSQTRRPPGGDGWIWIVASRRKLRQEVPPSDESLDRAQKLLDGLMSRYEEVETSKIIPKVKSKTSGPSKKMVKDDAARQCETRLREIGREWPCGKWLFFENIDFVDRVFAKFAKSIVDGPLSKLKHARCHTIKVATADSLRTNAGRSSATASAASSGGNSNNGPRERLICVYFENVWNGSHAKEVLECLVKEHGEIPSAAKPDLYTMIGLDSKHPSNIRSTLFKAGELFNWEEMRDWQKEYRKTMSEKYKAEKSRTNDKVKDVTSTKALREAGEKRKYDQSGIAEPVAPEDFWPAPEDDLRADQEEVQAKRHKVDDSPKADPSTTTRSVAPTISKGAKMPDTYVPSANDDSDTEPESDEGERSASSAKKAREATPPPLKTSPVAGATASGSGSGFGSRETHITTPIRSPSTPKKPIRAQEPLASFDREREARLSRSPDDKIKETPVIVLRTKKRDRFGRSDF